MKLLRFCASLLGLLGLAARAICTMLVIAASLATGKLFAQVEWSLRNPTPSTATLTGVAASDGRIVCVVENGTTVTSPDGEHWTEQPSARTVRFYRIEFVDDTFIARTDSGSIYFSSDGRQWEQRLALAQTGSSTPRPGPVIHGNGVYAAVDAANQHYHTSTDGRVWTERVLPNEPWPGTFAFGAGVFVAVTAGSVYTSTDAITWSARVHPDLFNGTPSTMLYAAGQFVALFSDGTLARSSNGRDWSIDPEAHAGSVGFANGRFLARIGEQFVTSSDAHTWTPLASVPAVVDANRIVWLAGAYVAASRDRIFVSPDLATWHEAGSSFETSYAEGLAFAAGQFLTYDGHVSVDGINWATTGFTPSLPLPTNAIPRIASANNRFFFFNDRTVFTSADGQTGQQVATLTFTPTSVAFGQGRYVVAGYLGIPTKAVVATSSDGTTWTEERIEGSSGIAGILFAAGQFVAVCHGGEILSSADGLVWRQSFQPTANASLFAVAYGNNRWIATGRLSLTSTDGTTWKATASIPEGGPILFAGGTFVIFTDRLNPDAQVATSTDGLAWTFRYADPAARAAALAHGNGTWVAASARGTILQSPDADLAAAPHFTSVTDAPYAVSLGDTLALSATAAGSQPITYQWILDGEPIAGATSASFTVVPTKGSAVPAGDRRALTVRDPMSRPATTPPSQPTSESHRYTLEARNASGTGVFGFTVTTYYSPLPTVTTQFARIGNGTADLAVSVIGAGPFRYQWSRNGVPIAGATGSTLSISVGSPADNSAVYTVDVTNPHGVVASRGLSVAPQISYSPSSVTAQPGTFSSFSVSIDPSSPGVSTAVSIWTKNGQVVGRAPFAVDRYGSLSAYYSFSPNEPSVYGVYQVTVSTDYGSVTSQSFTLSPPPSTRLVNLSARARVGTGDDVMIVGFIGNPGSMPNVLVRGVGQTLAQFGVRDTLFDPMLSLHTRTGQLAATNDQWDLQPDFVAGAPADIMVRIGAFPLTAGSADAAIFRPISDETGDRPTNTVILSGKNGGTGVALLEIYDYAESSQRLINLSARARVGSGEDVLIAGFVIAGDKPLKLLLRAVGPTIAAQGIAQPLANPKLTLYDSAGHEMDHNDQWNDAPNLTDLRAAITATGAFALNEGSNDAAMLKSLAPGVYTLHVTSVDGTSGVALVEIYEAP